jgi:tRNA 2-thiocytidine biosynthesis protein TtcA
MGLLSPLGDSSPIFLSAAPGSPGFPLQQRFRASGSVFRVPAPDRAAPAAGVASGPAAAVSRRFLTKQKRLFIISFNGSESRACAFGKDRVLKMSEKTDAEITPREAENLPADSRVYIDIRDDTQVSYGMIPGALHIPEERLAAEAEKLPRDRRLILYCPRGIVSLDAAGKLRQMGLDACSLQGGYNAWLLMRMDQEKARETAKEESGEKTRASEIEHGLSTGTFHRLLFTPFARAIRDYHLLAPGDRVAVCISGGKDSMLMAKLFQELQRHHQFPFELVFLCMDPGYSEANRRVIENNAQILHIPLTIFETRIFDAVDKIEDSPCYLCARMRRGYLYKKAQELGCTKIALGHHYDDVIETTLMGILYGGQFQAMMPRMSSIHFEGMSLIRPMYLIRENDIKKWRDANGLHFIQCACHFTDTCTTCRPDGRSVSKRQEVKRLIAELKKTNPYVEANIFKSTENVNLSTVLAYKQDGVRHRFTDGDPAELDSLYSRRKKETL